MSKKTGSTTQGWLDKLIGKEVEVENRSEDHRYLGILRHVDLEPIKASLGPTVVLQSSSGGHAVVFDVSVIDDEGDLSYVDDDVDDDDVDDDDVDDDDVDDDNKDDGAIKF